MINMTVERAKRLLEDIGACFPDAAERDKAAKLLTEKLNEQYFTDEQRPPKRRVVF